MNREKKEEEIVTSMENDVGIIVFKSGKEDVENETMPSLK